MEKYLFPPWKKLSGSALRRKANQPFNHPLEH
jgi:hypothetical protein